MSAPKYPLKVEVDHYRQPTEEGSRKRPITLEGIQREQGERMCLGRLTLEDTDGKRAHAFLSIIRTRGGLMVELEQDQGAKIVQRTFKLWFQEKPSYRD